MRIDKLDKASIGIAMLTIGIVFVARGDMNAIVMIFTGIVIVIFALVTKSILKEKEK